MDRGEKMPDDPLMQFVKGGYGKPRAHAPRALLLTLGVMFFLLGGFMSVDAVKRLSPLNPTMEARGIIKSKSYGAGHFLFSDRRLVIGYYYPIEANPKQQNIINGFHGSSWLFYRQVEIGDEVTIKYNPSVKNPRKRSYVEGSRPIIKIGFQFFMSLISIVLSGFLLRFIFSAEDQL